MFEQSIAGNAQFFQDLLIVPILKNQAQDLPLPGRLVVGLDQFRRGGPPSVPLLLLQAAGVGQVDVVGQNPEIEGLLLREQPLPSGAVEGQPPQHLLTVDQVHLEAVVKPIAVALIKPIGGDGEPLLLPQNLAVPEKHRLPGMAEPGGVGLVDALDPALLHRLEGFQASGQQKGVPWRISWLSGSS